MSPKSLLPAILISVCSLWGCAANDKPIIDRRGVSEAQFQADWSDCEAYSDEVEVGKGVAKGTAVGAAVGAIAGAISGDASESAGLGGLYGGTRSGLDADRDKQRVFKRCMAGRGYNVLN